MERRKLDPARAALAVSGVVVAQCPRRVSRKRLSTPSELTQMPSTHLRALLFYKRPTTSPNPALCPATPRSTYTYLYTLTDDSKYLGLNIQRPQFHGKLRLLACPTYSSHICTSDKVDS